MLYPQQSATRTVIDLSGMWKATYDLKNEGLKKNWYRKVKGDCDMPVPSSWNDLHTDYERHIHMGGVWYVTDFVVPAEWTDKLVWLRFNSATYRAKVWINDTFLGEHEGGYSPFEFMVNDTAKPGKKNKLVVYVDYILSADTIPQGNLPRGLGGYAGWHETNVPSVPFDFFPYGGIHRPVQLYATSKTYIDDITVNTLIKGKDGIVEYDVAVKGAGAKTVSITVGGAKEEAKLTRGKASGKITIKKCKFWHPDHPNLYDMVIKVKDGNGNVVDEFIQVIGVRTVGFKGTKFLINGKPFYMKGFGRHEDFFCSGKAQNLAVMTRDYNTMKWIGANSFRTSHYPYSEEEIAMADRQGFLVCVEAPSVTTSMRAATDKTLKTHIQAIREMYHRDKNHPSVVMWSVADENEKGEKKSLPYFTAIMKDFRKLEKHRPISHALTLHPDDDKIGQLFDFIIFNIYSCWYGGGGLMHTLDDRLKEQVEKYWKKFKKPILIGEFGAGSFNDLHHLPGEMWTQEYHVELIQKTIAWYRKQKYIIGEHLWVLNDFKVAQSGSRTVVNRKGAFTRDRQPKMVAHELRRIWDKKNDKNIANLK